MTLIVWNLQSLALFGNIELADTNSVSETLSNLSFYQELFLLLFKSPVEMLC